MSREVTSGFPLHWHPIQKSIRAGSIFLLSSCRFSTSSDKHFCPQLQFSHFCFDFVAPDCSSAVISLELSGVASSFPVSPFRASISFSWKGRKVHVQLNLSRKAIFYMFDHWNTVCRVNACGYRNQNFTGSWEQFQFISL